MVRSAERVVGGVPERLSRHEGDNPVVSH